jgi:hypothetical protein
MRDRDRQRSGVIPPLVYDEFAPLSLSIPEHRLLVAVVLRAVFDYLSKSKFDRHHRRSARKFLFSDDPEHSDLLVMAELFTPNPDEFVRRLRYRLLEGTLKPHRAAVPD